jgi:hypothetical protein
MYGMCLLCGCDVLLDERIGSDEGLVLASKLLDKLLVLVELLQVVGAHGVDAVVLRTIDVVLVTKNANGQVCGPALALSILSLVYPVCDSLGRGMVGSLTVPEKRLSRWGS